MSADQDKQVKKLVNRIFAMKGLPKVTKFAAEFSDGSKYPCHTSNFVDLRKLTSCAFLLSVLFQKLFNILYEENINCRLSTKNSIEEKTLNWNRINV